MDNVQFMDSYDIINPQGQVFPSIMVYHTTDGDGITEINPPIFKMRNLLDHLGKNDCDYEDVSLTHESGWTLSAYPSGIVTLEDLNERQPLRFLKDLTQNEMLELWVLLSKGEVDRVFRYSWIEE